MNFNDDFLLWLARMIGIAGLGLLIISGVGGVLLASRLAQKIKVKWLRGKTFKNHRLLFAALFAHILLTVVDKINDT